jgi:hypothetical protein
MKSRLPFGNYLSAAPDIGMALTFLITWIAPTALGQNMIKYLMLVMLMEFISIHSSAFFAALMVKGGSKGKKTTNLIALGGFYTIFVAGFSLSSGEWWPIVAFWGLMANRLLSVWFGTPADGKETGIVLALWVAGIIGYLGGVSITVMLPMPQLGVTDEVIRTVGMGGEGMWIDQPHTLLAFGVIYFSFMAVAEIFIDRWSGKIQVTGFSEMKSSLLK